MDNNNSGDSNKVTAPMYSLRDGEATSDNGTNIPQEAESSQPKEGGEQVLAAEKKEEIAEQPAKGEQVEEKSFQKQASEAHRMVIDLVEEKLDQVDQGLMDEEELREWFNSHQEFANVADRSKRLKERYRGFMEAPATKAETKVEAKIAPEERPITLADLKKYDEERESRLLAKTLSIAQERNFEKFAAAHKMVDDRAAALKRNAEALFKANPDWSYDEALESAYAAIEKPKGKPVNLATVTTSTVNTELAQSEKVDATKGVSLWTKEEFFGKK